MVALNLESIVCRSRTTHHISFVIYLDNFKKFGVILELNLHILRAHIQRYLVLVTSYAGTA